VEPVRQLDDQDPDIPGHGDDHLPHVLRLLLLPGPIGDLVELGQAVHDRGHVGAELAFQVLQPDPGVLHHVVEEPGHQGRGIHAQVGEHVGDLQRVADEGLAGLPELSPVRFGRELVGPLDLPDVRFRVVAADPPEEAVQAPGNTVGRRPRDEGQAREDAGPSLRRPRLFHATSLLPTIVRADDSLTG
jgi:hypothetical protein